MRNFLQIADHVDVTPLLLAIQRQSSLWNQHRLRTMHPHSPHGEVDDIWIRFNDVTEYEKTEDSGSIIDDHESMWYPPALVLPQVRPLVFGLMTRVEGERLGRVLITRLAPGNRIAPHADGGSPATYYERFHVSLQCPQEALFRTGDDCVYMPPGTCWWFNNTEEHEIWNDGTYDRITLIIDIRVLQEW